MDYLKKKNRHYGPSAFSLQLPLNACKFTWLSSTEATCTVSHLRHGEKGEESRSVQPTEFWVQLEVNVGSFFKPSLLNTNGHVQQSASPVFCSKPPQVFTDWRMFYRENVVNESCVLIFFFSQNAVREEPRKTIATLLPPAQTRSPTSISSRLPPFAAAFMHKQKQTLIRSVHKTDDWGWKTRNAKVNWTAPFLFYPNYKAPHKLLTVWFCCTRWKGERGIQMLTDLQYLLHNV